MKEFYSISPLNRKISFKIKDFLIQPIGGPSTWQDFLEKYGEGIHHIAFNVENLEGTLEKFRRMGIEMKQKGEFKGGCYVYTNSKSELGAIIELLHRHS